MYNKIKYLFLILTSFFAVSLLTGCTKDQILSQYNHVLQVAGDVTLTDSFLLQGKRKYGIDHYTGTYTADYRNFSKTEYLFGGTFIERENGKDITVSCELEITEGTAQIFWISGNSDPVILLEEDGSCTETITMPEGGNYIGITGDGFTGSLELCIE